MSKAKFVPTNLEELAARSQQVTIKLIPAPTRRLTKDDLQDGKSALELAKENLQRKLAGRKMEEIQLLDSVREFGELMSDILLPHIAEINSIMAGFGEDSDEYLEQEYIGVKFGVEKENQATEVAEGKPEDEQGIFTIGDELREVRSRMDKYLNCGDPRVSLPLEATEVAFWLSHKPLGKTELAEEIRKLVQNSVLIQDRRGDIEVLPENYFVHKRFDVLKEPQKTEVKGRIKDAVRAQANRLRQEEEEAKAAKAAEVKAKIAQFFTPESCNLPILEVLDETKTGTCAALVPGGAVWFQVDADTIELLDVAGAPENGFVNLATIEQAFPGNKVVVNRKTLKGKSGSLAKKSDFPRVSVPLEISKDKNAADRWVATNKFAWFTVRGAVEFALDNQRKATEGLTHDEFHEEELGKYKPNMEKYVFNSSGKETEMTESELEVERFETPSGKLRIRVVGYAPEFAEFLERQGCLNPEGFPQGEIFDGCPLVIKNALKRDFGMKPADKTPKANGQPKPVEKPAVVAESVAIAN